MIVTSAALDALRVGFRADFQRGFAAYAPLWNQIATLVPSSTGSNRYGWLREFPRLREWLGDRIVKSISEGDYSIVNRDFESTVGVKRKSIEDDELGIYSPMMQGLGDAAAQFPDGLVFALLAAGFVTPCWDGQYFFDVDHPVLSAPGGVVSNMQAGASPPWILMDTSRPLKPLIYQERKKPNFVAMTQETDEVVFTRFEYRYGVDLRANAGYGFWQMAFGSQAALTAANYEAAVTAMTSQENDEGQPIMIKPNLIVVGPSNRAAAKRLFGTELINGGETNIYFKDVEIMVSPWLA